MAKRTARAAGFYQTIEYIGPRPQKPKRRNPLGGWVILIITAAIGFWIGRPLVPFLRAAQAGPDSISAQKIISSLDQTQPQQMLVAAALSQACGPTAFDDKYYKISYPGGDVSPAKGKAEDVVIRSYRKLGTDLQKEVHEDMAENLTLYPNLWNSKVTDTNIDHRRTPNLQRFFARKGQELSTAKDPAIYLPGDVVIWALRTGDPHIGIVVPSPANDGKPWVVHHLGSGIRWEDSLLEYQIIGHYRYDGSPKK